MVYLYFFYLVPNLKIYFPYINKMILFKSSLLKYIPNNSE